MPSADQQPQTRSSCKAPSLAAPSLAAPSLAAPSLAAPSLVADLADLGRTLRRLFDPYRPERHYMRGPGPKWHAKHDPAPAVDATAAPALVPANG